MVAAIVVKEVVVVGATIAVTRTRKKVENMGERVQGGIAAVHWETAPLTMTT